ncbi:hypothetical protein WR25_14826 [Diploscapter pachys]|uniref:Uncharacterized protein n=1 Tax=Diploscapter pachys TaxID=2018661 RepID=A0A2A2JYT1_9BILA|nr:hypothetical protein WR25_14826 [Diploscapter pachys]
MAGTARPTHVVIPDVFRGPLRRGGMLAHPVPHPPNPVRTLGKRKAPEQRSGASSFIAGRSRERIPVSNWWYGGGEDSVHSSVVAPSPQGLSGAFGPAISE